MSDIQTLIQTVKAENLATRNTMLLSLNKEDIMLDILVQINQSVLAIKESLFDFFDAEQERYNETKLAAIERMREQSASLNQTGSQLATREDAKPIEGAGLFGAMLAALPALLIGTIEGLFDSVRLILRNTPFLKSLPALVSRLFSPITDTLTKTFGKQSRFFAAIKGIGDAFDIGFQRINSGIRDVDGRFRKMTGLERISKSIGGFAKILSDIATKVLNYFNPGNVLKPLTDGAGRISSFFKSIGSTIGRIGSVLRNAGRLIGRLAAPIAAIMAIFDTVTGAIDGFKEQEGSLLQKLTAGLIGGLKGLITGLFFVPLDLLKSGVSWVAEQLGATDVAEFLDSFSFEEIVGSLFDGLKDILVNIDQYVSDAIDRGKDLLYSLGRTLKISDYDPEAEQRIAQREISGAQEEITELEARDYSSFSERDRKRAEASRTRRIAELQSNITEAQQRSDSATQAIGAAEAAATPEPPPPPPPSDLFQVMDAQGEVTDQFSTYEEASAAAAELGGGAYAMANPNPTPAEEKTIAATEKTADATELLVEKATEKGSLYVHDVHVQEAIAPLVQATEKADVHVQEAIAPLVQATTSYMNAVQSSSNPSSLNSLSSNVLSSVQNQNQISPTTINQNVGGTPNSILNSPVNQASRNVQSAASTPIIISNTTGGSNVSTNVNNNSTTMIGGGPSARSSDASHRRLQDRMQGVV
jgi:hypothetical protein